MSIKKGDVVLANLNPQAGHEQAGTRPCLVVSTSKFNKATGFAWVCPITNQTKGYPFEVIVKAVQNTTGVILTDQLKSLDIRSRNMKVIDSVNSGCLKKVERLISLVLGDNE